MPVYSMLDMGPFSLRLSVGGIRSVLLQTVAKVLMLDDVIMLIGNLYRAENAQTGATEAIPDAQNAKRIEWIEALSP